MRAQQVVWNHRSGWTPAGAGADKVPLVLYFGTREALSTGVRYNELRIMFPAAHILGCSTGGQINNNDVNDDEIVAAAISFDATRLRLCREEISDPMGSRNSGEAIGRALAADDLAGVFVLSDGSERQRQRIGSRHRHRDRPVHPIDRRPCRRRRRLQGDTGRRRLRAAPAHHCGDRLLWRTPSGSATAAPAAGICSDRAAR